MRILNSFALLLLVGMVINEHIPAKKEAKNRGFYKNGQRGVVLGGLSATLAKAKRQNKAVYLLFTGSDWSPSCMSHEKLVLQDSRWERLAQNNMVTYTCDFPVKEPLSKQTRQDLNRLANSFGVTQYPTQIILDPSGKELARREGYKPGPAGPYINWVRSILFAAR